MLRDCIYRLAEIIKIDGFSLKLVLILPQTYGSRTISVRLQPKWTSYFRRFGCINCELDFGLASKEYHFIIWICVVSQPFWQYF